MSGGIIGIIRIIGIIQVVMGAEAPAGRPHLDGGHRRRGRRVGRRCAGGGAGFVRGASCGAGAGGGAVTGFFLLHAPKPNAATITIAAHVRTPALISSLLLRTQCKISKSLP